MFSFNTFITLKNSFDIIYESTGKVNQIKVLYTFA